MARNEVSTVMTVSLIIRLTGADKIVQDRVHPGFQIREERDLEMKAALKAGGTCSKPSS